MTGSKRGIEKILWNLFYDEIAGEYTSTSFSRNLIFNQVLKEYPNSDWNNDVYYVIKKWQRACDNFYDGIFNENRLLLEAGVTDTREICERKYNNFLTLFANKKQVPLYYDHDIKEWRAAKSLQIFEEIIGDKILTYHNLRNENLTRLAKRGGRLLSGVDSRKIVFDLFEETKKLENKQKTDIKTIMSKKNKRTEES